MKSFWDFNRKEIAAKLKITRECSDICKSIFKSKPYFLHPFIDESIQRYRNLNFTGIEKGYQIYERFIIRENGSVVLVGAIILPELSDNMDQRKKSKPKIRELDDRYEESVPPSEFQEETNQQMVYSLNLYKFNDKEEAHIFMQFKLYEGEGMNMIVQGEHKDFLNCILARGLQTKNQGGTVEGWLGQNRKKLQAFSECVFTLAECYFFLMEKCFS